MDALVPIGIDFGTTNSSIALANERGEVRLAQFAHSAGVVDAYRSLLYFDQLTENRRNVTRLFTGPRAIEEYLQAEVGSPGTELEFAL